MKKLNFKLGYKLFFSFLIAGSVSVPALAATQAYRRADFAMQRGEYLEASQRFYNITKNSRYKKEHPLALYNLGRSLSKLNLNQSAINYLTVIAKLNRGQVNNALEVLYELGFEIGDQESLGYALSKINLKKFPKDKQDLLYYRLGEVYLDSRSFSKAAAAFARVPSSSSLYAKAQYNRGLAFAELGNAKSSVISYTRAVNARRDKGVTDTQRVGALMGRARALYQAGQWDGAIATYRMIPRDSHFWHDSLFETSWAMLRSGRFRSALSNFQSLHSEFYDDKYQPESLILRSIVYLYICRYEEVDKVLATYDETYGKVLSQIKSYVRDKKASSENLYQVNRMYADIAGGKSVRSSYNGIPGLALKYIAKTAAFSRDYEYLKNLYRERDTFKSLPQSWQASNLGAQTSRHLNRKIDQVEAKLSAYVENSLKAMGKDLIALNDQKEYIKYEVLNAQTEGARKELTGNEAPESFVDSKTSRNYYIQNGYEYWPFQGEYWLDEIGNYHYVGTSQCQ